MPDRLTRLLHPVFLIALAALVVNDHVLKETVPGALTGKLSDVAGLVVLPVLLCVALDVQTRRWAWPVHLSVGALFAGVQFVSVADVYQATGLWVVHTPDPSDLAALAVLPVGVRLSLVPPARWWTVGVRRRLAPVVAAAAAVAVVATSPPPRVLLVAETDLFAADDPVGALALLEQRLRSTSVDVVRTDTLTGAEWAERMDVPDPEAAATRYDSLRAVWAQEGRARYRITAVHPLRPTLVASADLHARWDPATRQLSAVLYEPQSFQSGLHGEAEKRRERDVRELLQAHVVRPLQDAGVRARLDGR